MAKISKILTSVVSAIFILSIIIAIVVFTRKYNNRNVNEICLNIKYPQNKALLNDSIMLNYLKADFNYIEGKKLKDIDVDKIIYKISRINAVDTVIVSCGVKNILEFIVVQKNPIAKVVQGNDEIKYLTDQGELVKSSYYSGNSLPTINGNVGKDTYLFVLFLENDDFLNKVTDYLFMEGEKLVIKTNQIPQPVYVGKMKDFNEKSKNLRYFLEATTEEDLAQYKAINLDYKNQILAIK